MESAELAVCAAGRQLWVRKLAADRSGPTLVFLHEGLGCIEMWRDFPDQVCADLDLPGLVFDRWGYGRSERRQLPWPASYLHDEARIYLPAVLDQCGVRHAILIGHSDGGSIALLYAGQATRTVDVRAVVTEAAHVMTEGPVFEGIRAAVRRYSSGDDWRKRLERYHGNKADFVFRGWSDTWLSNDFRTFQIFDQLARITCSVLAIQGSGDEYGTPAQLDRIAEFVTRASTLLIPGCGHAPHREAPQVTLGAITAFLRPQLRA